MHCSSKHIEWLIDTKEKLATVDGKNVKVFKFCHKDDDEVLSTWATHFRNHYCLDSEIDSLREGTGYSRTEYLNNIKLPTTSRGFGPGIRAGDFGEILVADYLEFVLGYWVPRTRYDNKTIRDESTKGSDLIGFKLISDDESPHDVLSLFEVKCQFSGNKTKPKLQEAVNHSIKDEVRKAESLNAIKQRLLDKQRYDDAKKIARFQNPVDKPYKEVSGAAALFSTKVYDKLLIAATNTNNHPNQKNLILVVIYGGDLMQLVNTLYKRVADEA
jgi:hypothetical protein